MYKPELHTVSNKPYAPAQAVPTDARSYYYDEQLFLSRPYKSKQEVMESLTDKNKVGHYGIIINIGGVLNEDGSFTGGHNVEHWFQDGHTINDLIPKGEFYPWLLAPASVKIPAGKLLEKVLFRDLAEAPTAQAVQIGTTEYGQEVVSDFYFTRSGVAAVDFACFFDDTTIYLSGLKPTTEIKLLTR